MADKAMQVYLNDHLAGAMFGRNLARQMRNSATTLVALRGSATSLGRSKRTRNRCLR